MPDHLGIIALGFAASLATGLATGLGALPAIFLTRATDKLMDGMLGFAAGVMLAVTVFGLLIPAIDEGGIWVTMLGLVVGMAFLFLMDSFTPHPHFILNAADFPNSSPARLRRIWLLLLAITIHNLPEGFAVGVTFGADHIDAGVVLALGIGIQNLPEGLAVALPLVREGYSPRRGIGYATLSGLAEPLAGLVGVSLVVLLTPLLPVALAFAAGAMMYVLVDEIIPESHRRGHDSAATVGTLVGFGLMLALERLFS
jgi:ZIP family zinc transporter